MNIKFNCFCGQPIEVDSSGGGQSFNCPSCGTKLTVPSIQTLVPPVIPITNRAFVSERQETISGGVFKGLVAFFIILPITIFCVLMGVGSVLVSTNNHNQSSNLLSHPTNWVNTNIIGNWELGELNSDIDGTRGYTIRVESNEDVEIGFGQKRKASLIIRRFEQRNSIFVNFGTFLGIGDIPVTYRLGQNIPQNRHWYTSTDYQAIFVPDAVENTFITDMKVNNTLVVRVTPHGESPVTVTFDLSGLSEALSESRLRMENHK